VVLDEPAAAGLGPPKRHIMELDAPSPFRMRVMPLPGRGWGPPRLLIGHVMFPGSFPCRHRAPQLTLGNSKVESYDSGPLEAACAASPKGLGLPTAGAMRDLPTTLKGNDGGSRAALVGSSRTLPCDVSR
jgi:hypothetical protein